MERSLISFIWRHSRRDQFVLVIVTLALFPLLYLTLELPKRIINDAIGAAPGATRFLGIDTTQKTLLIGLCLAFLASVIVHGLMKMKVNTMKGVLAERLLRRFRYLLSGRILRFPRSHRVSEGELAAMVTAEAEPLGGIMGDAFAHPLLQAGQMATILLFLFVQNVWFGLAAVALIPVQAWLIPRMQARINILNRSRIRQVRGLASEIGELSEGAAVLRQHGGGRYRMAAMSARLGRLFETRFDIYRRKYFMKFFNNFLTQLTPFFYFLIGGLLVIDGQLTLGALVAALAAFKDLSDPWKELLIYYTAVQEVSQRYRMIVERFEPPGLLAETRSETSPPQGAQTLTLKGVGLEGEDGHQLLTAVDLMLEPRSWTCIVAREDEDCDTLALMFLNEVSPQTGRILWGDAPLAGIAGRIAHVTSTPHLFEGTLGENVMLPLRQHPGAALSDPDRAEAARSGNSTDNADSDWHAAPEVSARADADWRTLTEQTGTQRLYLLRVLDTALDDNLALRARLVDARAVVSKRLEKAKLTADIQSFGPESYVDDLPLVENLLRALPANEGWHDAGALGPLLSRLGLRAEVLAQGQAISKTLLEVFDVDGTQSVPFQRLGLPENLLERLKALNLRVTDSKPRKARQRAADEALLISLALNIPAAELEGIFSEDLKASVLAARPNVGPEHRAGFSPLRAESWHPGLNTFENMIFGKVHAAARSRRTEIREVVVDVLAQHVDKATLSALIYNLPTARRGANLPTQVLEQVSLGQAVVKQAGLVILDRALRSHDAPARARAFAALRELLPDATIVQLENEAPDAGIEDTALMLKRGRFLPLGEDVAADISAETTDLQRKVQALRKAPMFRDLSRAQLRLLGFSARWLHIEAGSFIFRKNDPPDGAFLIYEGAVSLIERTRSGDEAFVLTPPPGTLVGELGLIRNDPRRLDMRADSSVTLLRIEAEDFLSILETDARTGFKLIQSLVGYLDRPG